MILIGLGSNLNGPWGTPSQTLDKAIDYLEQANIGIVNLSPVYKTSPLGLNAGISGQSVYANAVVEIATHLPPLALLQRLHKIEKQAGRRRGVRWRSRCLDIDLLDWHGVICGQGAHTFMSTGYIPLVLPHPGMPVRPFVLEPTCRIAPDWHHPVSGLTASQMLKKIHSGQGGKIIRR